MQLTFSFSCWHIEASEGILGRQYDNLAHSIVVVGSLPEGYTWDMLVECRGNYNIIPLAVNDTGASATLTADQLALTGYYGFQLRGTQDSVIHHTNTTQVFIPDTIVGPGTWPVLPTEFSEAEAAIKELNAHPPVPGENGYWMLWDLDTHAYVQSDLPIPGLTMQIGDTITGEPGTDALVENVGTPTAPKLQFTIPRGDEGKAATIQVGEVTASDPGSEPRVTNAGTENAAVLDFVLPRGQTGPTGQAATIEVESTVTGEPGTQASVENVGTTGAAKLRFTIPKGETGENGETPTLAAGNVETLEPGQPATASVTGEGPEYQINLGIPKGKTGETGAQGVQGEIGPRGYTFTPAVDDAGNLSWTNDGGLPDPEEVNIKGPIGATGPQGNPGATPTITVGTVTTLDPGQDATAEITGETPNLVLYLGIPEGQPGKDGVQLNDSAVNTTEAWSSKKIVDTLCPSFTETGNPVVCHPVEGYPLSAVVSLEPKQAGTGDPSPENVRPISGWDSVQVTRCGKNLWTTDISYPVANDLFNYDEGTQTYTFFPGRPAWSSSIFSLPFPIQTGTKVTCSIFCESGRIDGAIYFGGYNKYNPASWQCSVDFPRNQDLSGKVLTNTMVTTAPLTNFWAFFNAGCEVLEETKFKVMYFIGENSGNWKPYQPGTTATLTLPETIYGGTVDAVSGVGSKTWGYIASYNGESLPGEWISDRDVYSSGTTPTTGAQVAYKLSTPEPFQATGNQPIPALAGENTVYTDGDSVSVSGRSDPLSTIQTMQAQITALQDQATQGGTA